MPTDDETGFQPSRDQNTVGSNTMFVSTSFVADRADVEAADPVRNGNAP